MVQVRRIRADEWQLYREVRLAALTEAPAAFSSKVAKESAFPDERWQARAQQGAEGEDCFCAVAIDDQSPVGIAVGLGGNDAPEHRYLVSMWVAPAWRGASVAADLLAAVIAWAQQEKATYLLAGVTQGNTRALAFYQKHGFSEADPSICPEHPAVCGCELVLRRVLA